MHFPFPIHVIHSCLTRLDKQVWLIMYVSISHVNLVVYCNVVLCNLYFRSKPVSMAQRHGIRTLNVSLIIDSDLFQRIHVSTLINDRR